MPVHGVGTYEEVFGYLGVGEAPGYQLEDFRLSGAEAGRVGGRVYDFFGLLRALQAVPLVTDRGP